MIIQDLLRQLDFTAAEAETYWALLNLENVSIRKVANYSDINRGTTYDALKTLQRNGLVTSRRSGEREYYSAESPEKLYDLIRERRKDLWQVQQQARALVPQLLARKAQPTGRPLVKYYEDDEGVVTILRDVLQTCGQLAVPEYCAYSSRPLRQYLYRKFPQFTERRITEGIMVRVIAIGEGGDPAENSHRKWLAEPAANDISSYTIIYGNKVAQISLADGYTPYGVVTEDAGGANMQRLLFDQIWHSL